MDQMTSSVARVASDWNPLGAAGWGDRVWSQFSPATDADATVLPCRPHIRTGDVRLHPGFHSQFLPIDRPVLVWLPPGFHAQPWRRHSVLYLQDGTNLSGEHTEAAWTQAWTQRIAPVLHFLFPARSRLA